MYTILKNDQDTANTKYQGLHAKSSSLAAQVSEAISWFEPELLKLSDEQIWAYFAEIPELEVYRHMVDQLVSNRTHVLSEKRGVFTSRCK